MNRPSDIPAGRSAQPARLTSATPDVPAASPSIYQGRPDIQHHYYESPKSPGIAAILEVLPGLLCQTFGIGHMYVGNVGLGLVVMFGYWLLLIVNVLLCFMCIGLLTLPLTWVVAMIVSPISAANAAREQAWRETGYYQ